MDRTRPAEERYRVVGRIAYDGETELFLADAIAADGTSHEVLLRRISARLREDVGFVRALLDAGCSAGRLTHPNIVQIHEVGALDGAPFISMDLVRGASIGRLHARLSLESKRLPLPCALRIAIDALAALEYAHEAVDSEGRRFGFLHLALSTENVLLSYDGRVKVADFGLAHAKAELGGGGRASPTRDNSCRAPEQIAGGQADARADLFALGVVLYQVMLGRHPFPARGDVEGANAALEREPTNPCVVDPSFPPLLASLLLRALKRDPKERFATAHEMKVAILSQFPEGSEIAGNEALGAAVRGLFEQEYLREEKARTGEDRAFAVSVKVRSQQVFSEFVRTEPGGVVDLSITSSVQASAMAEAVAQPEGESSLGATSTRAGTATIIRLSGTVDEKFNSERIRSHIFPGTTAVVFDMDGVRQITSYGIREWVRMLRDLPSPYYCFTRCHAMIAAQFNMVAEFGGRGELISLYAPYVCESCGENIERLLDMRRDRPAAAGMSLPEVACPKCKAKAKFADVPDFYFAYAIEAPPPAPPSEAEYLIDGPSNARMAPFRVRKEVEGAVTGIWLFGTLGGKARFNHLADGLEGVVVVDVSGIKGVTPEGVEALSQFLHSAGIDVYLSRLMPELILPLGQSCTEGTRVRVISARLPFQCPGCRWNGALDIEPPFDWITDKDSVQQLCHDCFDTLLVPSAGVEVVEALLKLPWCKAPDEAHEYLSSHIEGPARVSLHGAAREREHTDSTGTLGKYQLLKRLGTGGMAEVFLARQVGMGGFEKRVAIKRILPHLAKKSAFVELFLREARVVARLSHPHVVQIFDLGKLNDQYFIAMEYVNWDLERVLQLCRRLGTPIPVNLACRIGADVCAGLFAAHMCHDDDGRPFPVIHRDVSPQNVLISMEGAVKVSDFGIATAADSASSNDTGQLRGKVGYMAPELISGGIAKVDARSDIFSAGVVIYEALSLRPLFARETRYDTANAVLHDPIPRLSTSRPDVPPALEAVLDKAMARSPDDRYETALALQLKLEGLLTRPTSSVHLSSWLRALFTQGFQTGQSDGERAKGGAVSTDMPRS